MYSVLTMAILLFFSLKHFLAPTQNHRQFRVDSPTGCTVIGCWCWIKLGESAALPNLLILLISLFLVYTKTGTSYSVGLLVICLFSLFQILNLHLNRYILQRIITQLDWTRVQYNGVSH
ncbi:hypothetical protein BDW75DRAFT_32 [Aspergillus navahoensis]